MKRAPIGALIATILVATITLTSTAGPPLICHPFEIGDANCLPWGKDRWEAPRQLKKNLVEQVLDRLDPTMPAIVRMETIRRAVMPRLRTTLATSTATARSASATSCCYWRTGDDRGQVKSIVSF